MTNPISKINMSVTIPLLGKNFLTKNGLSVTISMRGARPALRFNKAEPHYPIVNGPYTPAWLLTELDSYVQLSKTEAVSVYKFVFSDRYFPEICPVQRLEKLVGPCELNSLGDWRCKGRILDPTDLEPDLKDKERECESKKKSAPPPI